MNQYYKWESRRLIDLACYINGYAFKPSDWSEEGLPIIRIEQLKNPNSISDYFAGILPAQNIICSGDLIFSWSASLFLDFWRNEPAALNQHLFKVVEKRGINRAFLKQFIDYYLVELTKVSHGSTMKHITRKELDPVRKGPEEYPAGFDGAGLTAISGVFNDIFSSDCHTDTNTT